VAYLFQGCCGEKSLVFLAPHFAEWFGFCILLGVCLAICRNLSRPTYFFDNIAMSSRRPLRLPITLGVVMMVLLLVLTVGWVLLAVFGAISDTDLAGLYWALLTVGTTFIALLLAGVIIYLALSIKAINLTRRQSNFIDSVTHELKSPIASMKLYLQTLTRQQVTGEERANFFQAMLEDVERLDQLTNQVLDAGRLDSRQGDDEEAKQDVSLGPVLRGCAEVVCIRYRVPPSTVDLHVEPSTVKARSRDLEMIFRNLIDNAVKYGGEEPRVEVFAKSSRDGMVEIKIADNGQGIPHKLRRKVFGRFVRLGFELERKKPGTGLGLYIVRMLVKRLGGEIRVADREVGLGTVFDVKLPGKPIDQNQGVVL